MTHENSACSSGVSAMGNIPSMTPSAESADTVRSATDSEVTTSPLLYLAVTCLSYVPGSHHDIPGTH